MADGILALNPLSYWAFPETSGVNAVNSAGGARAVLANGAAFSATGVKGRGVTLDGVNDLVSVAHSAAYALNQGAMSLWFTPDALGLDQGLISKNSAGLDAGGGFSVILKADGSLVFSLESSASTFTIQSAVLATAGAWNNVTISWGSAGMQLWLNGELVGGNAYTGGLGTSSGGAGADDPLVFGANTQGATDGSIAGATDFFKGSIDEAVVMSRQPTASEMTAIYQNGSVIGNADPVATADALAVLENGATLYAGNVLANDTDSNGNALSVFAVKGNTDLVGIAISGTYGVLTLYADGTYSYALNSAATNVQALRDGQVVTDTFAYTATDGNGGLSSASLVVTISGENDAPMAVADVKSIAEDPANVAVNGNVLTNDQDVDGGALSVVAVNGVADNVATSVAGAFGAIVIGANGAYTYTLANASAAVQSLKIGQVVTDIFTYGVSDGQGGLSTTTVTISITGKNDAPTVVADMDAVTPSSSPSANGNVLANDSDIDGDALFISAVKGQAANVGANINGTYGVLRLNADGSYTYTVNASAANVIALATGATVTDVFAYTAKDGTATKSSNLTITITGDNDAPILVNDAKTIAEDAAAPATGNALTNDRDPDGGTLSVSAVNGAGGNVGVAVTGAYGALTVNADGTYSYALANGSSAVQALRVGQSVTDTFAYTVSDGQGGLSTANIVITVTGKNDGPTVVADVNAATVTGAPVSGNVLANDSDIEGDAITVTAVRNNAANVGADVNGTYGVLHLNADGSYTYSVNAMAANVRDLAPGQVVTDTFAYTARDANNAAAPGSLTITIVGANDGPQAVNDARTIAEDPATLTASGNVLTNDSDPDGGVLSVTEVNGAAGNVATPVAGAYGSLVVNAEGTYTYTLANASAAVQGLRAGQSATDIFVYTLSDGQGGTATGSVVVTVTGKNDGPTAIAAATGSVTEDIAVTTSGSVLGSLRDADIGDTLTINQVKGQAGNVGASVAGTYGLLVLNADGTYTYTLNNALPAVQALNDGQTLIDTFAFRANDGSGLNVLNNLVITIAGRGENQAPVATADTFSGSEDAVATVDVRANDTDSDGDALTVTTIEGVAVAAGDSVSLAGGHSATLNADGTISVAPAANYNGDVTFAYTVSDGRGGAASSSATVSFAPANDAPVAAGIADQAASEDAAFSFSVPSDAFTDVDAGDTLNYTAALTSGDPLPSWLSFDALTRTFSGTPVNGDVGAIDVRVTATDGGGLSASDVFTLTVGGVVSAAAISFGAGTRLEDITRISVAANGAQANGVSGSTAIFSPDGNYVVFTSGASNLTPGDTNASPDVFLKNLATGEVTLLSANSAGVQGNLASAPQFAVANFSPDGAKVAFYSNATNLAPGDTNNQPDMFVKDLITGAVTRVSTSSTGQQANGPTIGTPIWSPDGTKLMFTSAASNLAPNDPNIAYDVYLKDLVDGTITLITTNLAGVSGGGPAFAPGTSSPPRFNSDGTKIVFESASILTAAGTDTNGTFDIFIKDLATGVTTRVSTDGAGAQANGPSFNPTVSPDGAKVMFWSSASNLVPGDTNAVADVFVKDLATGAITLVSADANGVYASSIGSTGASWAPDSRHVMFTSAATNLVPGDTNGFGDIFIKDIVTGEISRLSMAPDGAQGNGNSSLPLFSVNGSMISWTSSASNLVPGDTNALNDNFVAKLVYAFKGVEGGKIGLPVTITANEPGEAVTSVTLSGLPAGATLSAGTDNGDGSWTFAGAPPANLTMTSPAGYSGAFTLTVDATTSQGGSNASSSSTVTVTVSAPPPVNNAPVASNFTGSVNEDGSTVIDIQAYANDPDGNAIKVSRIDGHSILANQTVNVANGAVTLNADGTLTVRPTANSTAPVNFSYTVSDGFKLATANASFDVSPSPDAPVPGFDFVTTDEHTPITFSLLANDVDPDGDALTLTHINGQAIAVGQTIQLFGADGPSIKLNADGTVTFYPSYTPSGPNSFNYRVADPSGLATIGFANVHVNQIAMDAGIHFGDMAGQEDTTSALQINVVPGEIGDTVTQVVLSGFPVGSVLSAGAPSSDGTSWSFNGSPPPNLTYTPPLNYAGSFTFTVTATTRDDSVSNIKVATEVISIAPVNDAPVLAIPVADQAVNENELFTFTLPNGTFVEVDSADSIHYTASLANGDALPSWLVFDANTRTFSGTPTDDDAGEIDIRVTATDNSGAGNASSSDIFRLSVGGDAAPPAITFGAAPHVESIERISTNAAGGQVNGPSSGTAIFSSDNTRVVFVSSATDYVAGDTNNVFDVFVKNLVTGEVTRVSTSSSGAEGNNHSSQLGSVPTFSPDGTKVAFASLASNLVPGDMSGFPDFFVKDLITGVTTRVSTAANGAEGFGGVGVQGVPIWSPDGTKLLFQSSHNNLVPGDNNNATDLFLKDLVTGGITRISTAANGAEGNLPTISVGSSGAPRFSPDGTKIAFESLSTNLVPGDTNNSFDIFVKDLTTGELTRVTTDSAGGQSNNGSFAPMFSSDGTKLLFWSMASNLVSGDANGRSDVFMKDLVTGEVTLISATASGVQGNGDSTFAYFSPDGTKVLWGSAASNFVPGDSNTLGDIFVKDLATGEIVRISNDATGAAGNAVSSLPQYSHDGTMISFNSNASNLVPGDTNAALDMFIARVTTPFQGEEGGIVRLPINVATTEGGESITQVVITGLPEGSQLSAGSSADDGVTWTINGPPPADLTVTPPAGYAGEFTLSVTATSTQGATTANTTATQLVTVVGGAEAASLAFESLVHIDNADAQANTIEHGGLLAEDDHFLFHGMERTQEYQLKPAGDDAGYELAAAPSGDLLSDFGAFDFSSIGSQHVGDVGSVLIDEAFWAQQGAHGPLNNGVAPPIEADIPVQVDAPQGFHELVPGVDMMKVV